MTIVLGGAVVLVITGLFAVREYLLTKKISTQAEQKMFF
jgi:hypothetical protein